MTLDEYNTFCASLRHANHVVQWGGAHVWKVASKVFAIGGWDDGAALFVTFKCSPMSFEMLKSEPGLRPAPISPRAACHGYSARAKRAWMMRRCGIICARATGWRG